MIFSYFESYYFAKAIIFWSYLLILVCLVYKIYMYELLVNSYCFKNINNFFVAAPVFVTEFE
jgi:hypothetical protein